jgi:Ca2+-binding EF-hand superfamily protein
MQPVRKIGYCQKFEENCGMTTIGNSNPLSGMLNNAFAKFDKDGDGKLNGEEFKKFNEILKPGIAVDETGAPTVDYSERMDHNSDGAISQEEMSTTGVLMPATLTDPSLKSMLNYLSQQTDPLALEAAAILREAGYNAA